LKGSSSYSLKSLTTPTTPKLGTGVYEGGTRKGLTTALRVGKKKKSWLPLWKEKEKVPPMPRVGVGTERTSPFMEMGGALNQTKRETSTANTSLALREGKNKMISSAG